MTFSLVRPFRPVLAGVAIAIIAGSRLPAQPIPDRRPVGRQPDGRIVVPTNQVLDPAGTQVTFRGRPVDLALLPDGNTLAVKAHKALVLIDLGRAAVRQTLALPKFGTSVVGLVVDPSGERIYLDATIGHVAVARRGADGKFTWSTPLELVKPLRPPLPPGLPTPSGERALAGSAGPTGMALAPPDPAHPYPVLWVLSAAGNTLQSFNAATGARIGQPIPLGVAPYGIALESSHLAYVTNWGGDPPRPGEPQGDSARSPVRIDPRTGIANTGSVSVVDLARRRQVRTIAVGLHPTAILLSPDRKFLYVANANSDTVSVIETAGARVVETIPVPIDRRLPFGGSPQALAIDAAGRTLYVALGANNCIAVVALGGRASSHPVHAGPSTLAGSIPTGWYPGAVLLDEAHHRLLVANVKGAGSLAGGRPQGKSVYDYLGSVSIIPLPSAADLARHTRTVARADRLTLSLSGLLPPRATAPPRPVPERHGEPSPIRHVLYIIKENRSYDQLFGDLGRGNGDPKLVHYGRAVTPNHHALAEQFVTLDNFYCSGAISSDGHQWTDLAFATEYIERAFGGFIRSYPGGNGEDPLTYAPTGFLWDNALAHGLSFRCYGEGAKPRIRPATAKWIDFWRQYTAHNSSAGGPVRVDAVTELGPLRPYLCPDYAPFSLVVPDQQRANVFLREWRQFEARGRLPRLMVLWLPNDHTNGMSPGAPTPRAMVADNDLALGRIIEAVSHSRKFWPTMAVFVVEDDAQDGVDHVDGHRSPALLISPYVRRGVVVSTNYNQTGVVKTIELILGLPPMNQMDLAATPLRDCFQDQPDLSSFAAIPNRVPLDEMNPSLEKLKGLARYWARQSMLQDWTAEDRIDDAVVNRVLWFAARGDEPYPAVGDREDDDDD